jgi:hypothetical protein
MSIGGEAMVIKSFNFVRHGGQNSTLTAIEKSNN